MSYFGPSTRTRSLLAVIATLLLCASTVRRAAAQPKPNFVFIIADDQCYETIAEFGLVDIETPNLDRLVRSGTTFTHAYNMGSYSGAVCVASRTMLNTGRFLWHAQRLHRKAEQERQEGRFWSEYLKKTGYRTYMTGKWHVQAKADRAFDRVGHVRGGMPNQTKEGYDRPHENQPDPWSPYDPKFGGFWKGGKHWSDVVGDESVQFLEEAGSSETPFFMYLAFNAPHDPRQAPKVFVDKYPLERVRVPVNYLPEYPYKDSIGCGRNLRDEKLAPFPRSDYAVKVNRQEYFAIITHMDVQIGRILDAVDASPKKDNTWVFFTADHGLAVGHHGLMGKQNLFDHSVRVPLIVRGSGVAKGKRHPEPVYLQDIMPTTLELAGVPKPEHVQFQSLLPLLRTEDAKSAYDAIYGAYLAVQRSVTMDGHKLILYPKIQKALLFDLAADPLEMRDIADPARADLMRRMFRKLLELQKEAGDELDLAAAYPRLAASG